MAKTDDGGVGDTEMIYQGDCLKVLKTIEAGSVNCCITSPPYYGLRDYGTGSWEGGDKNCLHKRPDGQGKSRPELPNSPSGWAERDVTVNVAFNNCPCGAVRTDSQLGLEKTPEEYVSKMIEVFREIKRVLRNDGTLWMNLGDSYAGSGGTGNQFGQIESGLKPVGPNKINRAKERTTKKWSYSKAVASGDVKAKDLVGIPWMVAFALRADGWYLRQDIIWHKPNPMPESVTDRCTKAHEYIFLLSKSQKYYFDSEAIKERSVCDDPRMVDGFVPKSVNGKHTVDKQNSANRKKYKPTEAGGGTSMVKHNGYFKENGNSIGTPGFRNKRSVWSVTTSPFAGAHFATFPEELIIPCVLAGCPQGGGVPRSFFWRRHDRSRRKEKQQRLYWHRTQSRIY